TSHQDAGIKLLRSCEADAVRDRHRDWLVDLAEQAHPNLIGPDQAMWLDCLTVERDNLRVALQWCWDSGRTELGLRLAAALQWFWAARAAELAEGEVWL